MQTVLRFVPLTSFVQGKLLLRQEGEPLPLEPVEETSLVAWQGTFTEAWTGQSLLQHFHDCITCLLCISG